MKRSYTAIIIFAICASVIAQAPTAFNYQAVLRNSDGTAKANEVVALQISVIDEKDSSVYLEIHNTQTNGLGLVNVVIGQGTTNDNLSFIDWASGPYFIDISLNGVNLGSSPLLSVPYALYAASGNEGPQGPPGMQGIQGETGAQGESGDTNWQEVTDGINYNEGFVGIGTATPHTLLTVEDNRNTIGLFKNTQLAGFHREFESSSARFGIYGYPDTDLLPEYFRGSMMLYSTADAKNFKIAAASEGGNIQFLTGGAMNESFERMRILDNGNVGIGTVAPSAKLEVVGGVKIGSEGVKFSELIKLSGTTELQGTNTVIGLPVGWNSDNTMILNCEIKNKSIGYWNGVGTSTGTEEFSYHLYSDEIIIYYTDDPDLHATQYRLVLMKVE